MVERDKQTNNDKYKPTNAEKKLIEVLSNPENRLKSISEICRLAGISRDVYYTAMKKPEFVEYYRNLQYEIIKSVVGDVIAATVKFATTEPKCHQDRKILLEMADMYRDKKEISGADGGPIMIQFVESEEE